MEKNINYLLKNIGLLTLSNFGSKILVFLLVPIYTRLLTTEEYGVYDLYLTSITLLIPLLSLNIVEAVMRFTLDKKVKKENVLSIGIKIVFKSIIICCVLVIMNYFLGVFEIFNQYPQYFILYYSANIMYDLITQFVKSIEKTFDFAIASILNTATMLILNIIFLFFLKMKLPGYFLANILSFVIPIIYLTIKLKLWKYIKLNVNDEILKGQMLSYSKPLILNNIGWWITNVSDRYILTSMKGLSENGIYSISYKIPSILNVVQAIFSQAWIMSVVKAYENKEEKFISQMYVLYNSVLVILCSIIIIFTKVITKILVANDFYIAWKYATFLMVSVLFTSLSNFLGGILSATKSTKEMGKTTVLGAITNIILNFILIYYVGTMGAAISTLISYIIVWASRLGMAKKAMNLSINLSKDILAYIILIIQAIVLNIFSKSFGYIIEIALLLILIYIERKEIKNIFLKIKDILKK